MSNTQQTYVSTQDLQNAMNMLLAFLVPLTIRSNAGRLVIDINAMPAIPSITSITTLTTLTTLANQANIGGYNAHAQQQAIANISWNSNLTL